MPKLLPANPSLDHLRKQAKDLQHACQTGDPEASKRVRAHHPAYAKMPAEEIPSSNLTLRDTQLVVAREYYFENWARLKEYIIWDLVVREQDVKQMELLLKEKPSRAQQGIMRFRRDGTHWTNRPLQFVNNNIPMMKLLLEYGATLNTAGIFQTDSTTEFIDFALSQGADLEKKHYNGPVISHTARQANLNTLRYYIQQGANVNATCPKTGETPLHRAAFSPWGESPNHTEAVRILIEAGADINVKTNVNVKSDMGRQLVVQGETPLHFAAAYGEKKMVELLIEANADKHAETALGETALNYAQREKRPQAILDLLQ